MQALVVNTEDHPLPDGSVEVLSDIGWDTVTAPDYDTAADALQQGDIDAVLLSGPQPAGHAGGEDGAYAHLLRTLDAKRVAALVLSDDAAPGEAHDKSLVHVIGRDVSAAEMRGRLAMIERYHRYFKRMERELQHMESLGKRLSEHFRELDEEMRLAARLQRDFLPRINEPIQNVRFASIYRPATWVSGDTFDIFRIDEHYTGLYLADAVGHGMAASLLTMFIKRAIVPKRVQGDQYTVVRPPEVMAALNSALADQALPNCQFVTACYALFDHRSLTLTLARGGHPFPLHITRDGKTRELKTGGGLLGIFPAQEFPAVETQLESGDKLIFFTDGVELAFNDAGERNMTLGAFRRACGAVAHLHIDQMLARLDEQLDGESGSLNPQDDVTIVGMEVCA